MKHAQASCLNCGAVLSGPFCSACGQKAGPPVLTTRAFVRDTSHEFFDWDGKIPSTLKTLFIQPGVLTLDALAGRRARWLTPLRVYLICSIAFFATKPVVESVTGRSPRESIRLTTDWTPGQPITPEIRAAIEAGLPAKFVGADRVERLMVRGNFSREINGSLQKSMFLLLPVFALLTSLVWRRKLPGYGGHLIAAFHFQAAIFGALTLFWIVATLVPSDTATTIANFALLIYVVWYGLTAYGRIFNEPRLRTALKSFLVLVPYFFCFFLTGMAILFYTVWRM